MTGETIRIRRVIGTLRVTSVGEWQVRLNFEVEIPGEGVECWNSGTDWLTLGTAPSTPGFDGLRLAVESSLSEIEADIERRGCQPMRAFTEVHWSGEDETSRRALRQITGR